MILKAGHDIHRVRKREIDCIRKIMSDGGVYCEGDRKGLVRMIRDFQDNPGSAGIYTFTYSIDQKVVGFISLANDVGERTYEILALGVRPRCQGKGIAKRMIRYVESVVRKNRGRIMYISTSTSKEFLPARSLYRKSGYKKTATIRDYFEDGDHKVIYMKRLRKPRAVLA
ncbi:MAG: GNAT family N-acetyltransferase [Candidatus Altiarchaeales archaeon]|nr:GNAT family N-acetyltransferase [Candidatus Altiarchaeales archaeon]MBD3417006.1 GNAT family N-acetyltransferase [Candidatus Altiarchaeales archaeon]